MPTKEEDEIIRINVSEIAKRMDIEYNLKERIKELETERDYYKQRYLEFNDYFLKNNMSMEAMLKDLKRSKLYERSTNE